MFKVCIWCLRTIPVRPGSYCLPVAHVCTMFGKPHPYGMPASRLDLLSYADVVNRELFIAQASEL